MQLTNLSEEQRRDLASMFTSKGWGLLKKELDRRAGLAARSIIYGDNRQSDDSQRGFVKAIDLLFQIEKGIFAPPETEIKPPVESPLGDRYDV